MDISSHTLADVRAAEAQTFTRDRYLESIEHQITAAEGDPRLQKVLRNYLNGLPQNYI
jgi:hypothetical protein